MGDAGNPRSTTPPRRARALAAAHAGLAVVGMLALAGAARGDPTPPRAVPSAPGGAYYLQPLGEVDAGHAARACALVTESFALRCVVLRARPLPRRAFDPQRNQLDADRLIDALFADLPTDAVGMVGLTNGDLFDRSRTRFVFGLASLVDRVAVVSLARLRPTWWGEEADPVRFDDRLHKVMVHEVGHTLGLEHCPRRACAMREDRTLADLDDSPRRFCPSCSAQAAIGGRDRPGTARWHYLRGHAHLHRGQFPQAVFHFQLAAERAPEDARVANDLGVAFLRRGDGGRALWWFREAQRLEPGLALAVHNEGLVFLEARDASEARLAFERALLLDPTAAHTHRHLGLLFHDQGEASRALTHFQAYLDGQGHDQAIEARMRQIKGGGENPR